MRVAILEKEEKIRRILENSIATRFPEWKVFKYITAFELVTGVCDELKGDLDLIILRISSAKHTEVAVASDIQRSYPHIRVIFYSEDNNCAEEIFMASPISFLKLPFREGRLDEVLQMADNIFNSEQKQLLSIVSKGQIQRFTYSSIHYIECIGRKVFFYTDSGSFESYMVFSDILRKLPEQFIQCHRSYIVNMERVSRYSSDGLFLKTNDLIPISRSHQKEIKNLLQKF